MTDFRIANTFTDSLTRLTGQEQKAAKTTVIDLWLNPANPGHRCHRIDKVKDKKFWSVSVNDDIRIIVHRTAGSLLLCYVGHHDDAYTWVRHRKLETHPRTGAAQLVELREVVQEIRTQKHPDVSPGKTRKPSLFAHLSEEELLNFGVPPIWLADVRAATESTLLGPLDHLPDEAAEDLFEIAVGGKPKIPKAAPRTADPFEHPAALRRFRPIVDGQDLKRAMERAVAIPKGTRCSSKDEFIGLLETWLEATDEVEIGGAVQGRNPWIHIYIHGIGLHLNSDSKRGGIGKLVAHHKAGHLAWHVSRTQRGEYWKVVSNSPDRKPIPRVYLYLKKAAAGPISI